MNVDKLYEGMVVKNYKEMCNILGENYYSASGKVKSNQLEKWQRFFSYENKGHKFIIKTIYSEPLPDMSKIRVLYTGIIELLIMQYLNDAESDEIFISKSKLYQYLGMASKRYFDYKKEYHEGRLEDVCDRYCIQRVDGKLNDILHSALESMRKRFLITYRYDYVVYERSSNGYIIQRLMTSEEEKVILSIYNKVLNEYGEKFGIPNINIQSIYSRRLTTQFYSEVETRIKEVFPLWESHHKKLRIIKCNEGLKKAIPIKQDEIKKLSQQSKKIELNFRVCESLKKQMQNKYNNYWDKFGWMLINGKELDLPSPVIDDYFVERQDEFVDNYVRIHNIEEEEKLCIVDSKQ